MSSGTQPDKKKEKEKPKVILKLEWIYGIRKDICPNVFLLDKDTIIYPASNYIVVYNFTKTMGGMNLAHYIPGQKNSKGITAIATSNFNKKIVLFSEDLQNGVDFSFYIITIKSGLKNYPQKQINFPFSEEEANHTYCMAFSRKRKQDNYIVALTSNKTK